jgi:hypothetical protein
MSLDCPHCGRQFHEDPNGLASQTFHIIITHGESVNNLDENHVTGKQPKGVYPYNLTIPLISEFDLEPNDW